jgi:hypothetical protein
LLPFTRFFAGTDASVVHDAVPGTLEPIAAKWQQAPTKIQMCDTVIPNVLGDHQPTGIYQLYSVI